MNNLLTLHEAIVLALIDKKDRKATFDEIAKFLEDRKLFPARKGNTPLSTQVMLRSTKSNKRYAYLFEEVDVHTIRLKNLPSLPH